MMSQVMVAMRSQDYGSKSPITRNGIGSSSEPLMSTPPISEPLHIEKPNYFLVIKLPTKGVLQKLAFNPHARYASNYNIVEDLAISPSEMSALEVLQPCPAQRKLLLSAIIFIDPQDSNLMVFDIENFVPRLPHQMDFHIPVLVKSRRVFRTVIDEGESTCIMSLKC